MGAGKARWACSVSPRATDQPSSGSVIVKPPRLAEKCARRGRSVVLEAEHRGDRLVEWGGRGDIAHAEPDVVDAGAVVARSVVMDGLDAVPVRVEHEGAVIAR